MKKIFCTGLDEFNDPNERINFDPLIDYRSWPIDDWPEFDQPIPFLCALSGDQHVRSLLWAHYADKYYGVCIRLLCAERAQACLIKVNYDKNPLRTIADGITKAHEWLYEDEYRFLSQKGENHPNGKGHFCPLNDFGLKIECVEYSDRSIRHENFKLLEEICKNHDIPMVQNGLSKVLLSN